MIFVNEYFAGDVLFLCEKFGLEVDLTPFAV